MSYVVWFKDLTKDSISVAGGKGANLGEMTQLSLPVPYGFAVSAQCYGEYITRTGLNVAISDVLKSLDVENNDALQAVSVKIAQLFSQTPIPEDMAEEIANGYELLGTNRRIANDFVSGTDVFVAVRSSATAEDLPSASFAGQQATFLNVKGKSMVLSAVRDCWASLFTARAIYYRVKNNFDHNKVLISAIVQKMVNSDKAGIMFTINPATNDSSHIVIEAIYGLGELIVGGEVNPDLYIVNKASREIDTREIRKQTVGLFRKSTGDNEKLSIEPAMCERQKINDAQIKELARLGRKLEEHYGCPQDIEWAVENEEVFIVQTRAVTTFKNTPKSSDGSSLKKGARVSGGKQLLKGEVACRGVYTGCVKLVNGVAELSKVTKGDVMVTTMTMPDMVPAMQRAGAIVTDEGGMTCIEGDATLLTDKGFIKMRDVGDMLAHNIALRTLSVDSKTKKVIWRPIICSMKRKSKTLEVAPFLHFSQNSLSDTIKITADHKMPFLEGSQLRSLPLQDILLQLRHLLVIDHIPRLERDVNLDIFDQQKLMYLCGSVFSDGHIVKRKSGRPMRVTFSQKITPEKERYIATVTGHFKSLFGSELRNYSNPEALVHYQGSQWSRAANFECSQAFPAQTLQDLKQNFVQIVSSIDEKYLVSFLSGLIDGDGYYNKQKASIELYFNKNDTTLVQSVVIACLRLSAFPELSNPKENLIKFVIKDNVAKITAECTRIRAFEKEVQDRKLFDLQVFDSLSLKDWRGSLYQYRKQKSFVGINWLHKYLEGHCSSDIFKQIETLSASDLRMQRAAVLLETEEIDVYNVTIEAPSEEDHNYIVFTKHYTPLFVYNCHAAIVSREMGTPCIVGTNTATHVLRDGMTITVDAFSGTVYEGSVDVSAPADPHDLHDEEYSGSGSGGSDDSIITATEIRVVLDLPYRAKVAADTGADGIGLVRSEIIIAHGGIHPAEYLRSGREREFVTLLKEGIREMAQAFNPRSIWVRTSDMRSDEYRNLTGGDKEPKESDPMLGWHGIRRHLDEKNLLKAEFLAFKELYDEGIRNVGVMIPFVIRASEVADAKAVMREVGLEPCKDIEFGIMCETPAACWVMEDICREGISFVSFGTNDLTQLTLGIDRNNAKIAKLFDEMHPAVLHEIDHVLTVCHKYHVKTSICGQAGSRPEMAEFLVERGIHSISANLDAVSKIRRIVARAEKKILLEKK